MNKTKTLKLFIKLFKEYMLKCLKNAFYTLGDTEKKYNRIFGNK